MKNLKSMAFVLGLMPLGATGATTEVDRQPNVVAAYYTEWSVYARQFGVEKIPFSKITHLLYAFLPICGPNESLKTMNPNGHALLLHECQGRQDFEVTIHDTWAALGATHNNYGKLQQYKQQYPHLKVLISIGGWSLSDPFHYLVKTPASRAVFIQSVVRFLEQNPVFDGADLDWEYPGGDGPNPALGASDDGENFVALVQELRVALDKAGNGKKYLLTAAVGSAPAKISKVPYSKLFTNPSRPGLDLVFAMTYDYYGAWDGIRGHTAGLFNTDKAVQPGFNGHDSIQNLIKAGVPPQNLVLGVSMYGRAWQNIEATAGTGLSQSKTDNKASAWALENGMWEPGVMDYKYIQTRYRHDPQFTFVFDAQAKAPFLWSASQRKLISYDNSCSTSYKAAYAKDQNLAGVFAWEIDSDNGDILDAMRGQAPVEPCP
ncbi:MAG TPA: glycoside hydrolase family 18 protein [Oligoflexus sp.]|uniref:glycoside hydrolase family 18 protein n=1 Tax=Oligoflexus sp. TaxID=1971216 RepID=UPI002D50419A|nr:glycoside hydrolase family 18 protein [Oligoflexus sp.]HYX38881.1 glycoside hydrolase family 18 protein [Oligoflexus sp.]